MAATSGQIQPLKIPDAVVALAQAAAKANGETEKCTFLLLALLAT